MKIVDGTNAVLGRLASATAKHLLAGEEVAIVNAEKVIITGSPRRTTDKYLDRRRKGSPQHGPFFPTQANAIVKRAIRGMLPYKTSKGRTAMKRLKVYAGVPEHMESKEKENVADRLVRSDYMTVGEVSKRLR